MSHIAVEIQAVQKQYGALQALKGIQFNIQQGEFFGLLGPNGAGKSTLINIMAGLVRPTSGTVRVMGHDVIKDYRQSRMSIGVVPQELIFDPFFTVRDNLRLQSGYFGLGKNNDDWIDELLQLLDLTQKANDTMRQLSGGMKRRVLIAQALVHKPPVIVLDEPTAGVDVELRKSLWGLTRRFHAEGHTIVLTTHYLEEAEALCDRIAIINQGKLVALENKTELMAKYPDRLIQITLASDEQELPDGLQAFIESRQGKLVCFRVNTSQASVGDVLEKLHTAQVKVLDIETSSPGLEDVFMDVINHQVAS